MADFGRAMAPFPRVWGENESVDFIMPSSAKINNCHILVDLYLELVFFFFQETWFVFDFIFYIIFRKLSARSVTLVF